MRTLLVLFVLFFIYKTEAKELPKFLKICHRSDPKFEECLIEAVEKIKPYLVSGVPEYNIPSLEPLVINDLFQDEAAGMKISSTDVKTYGASNFTVEKIIVDLASQKYQVYVFLPELRIQTHYKMEGKLLLLPIKADGTLYANITNCKSIASFEANIYEKDGEKKMIYTKSNLKVDVGGGHVKLDSLFGDKFLNDVINESINKNLSLFLKELMPLIEKALAKVFIDIGNNIVSPFTYEQLFPQ